MTPSGLRRWHDGRYSRALAHASSVPSANGEERTAGFCTVDQCDARERSRDDPNSRQSHAMLSPIVPRGATVRCRLLRMPLLRAQSAAGMDVRTCRFYIRVYIVCFLFSDTSWNIYHSIFLLFIRYCLMLVSICLFRWRAHIVYECGFRFACSTLDCGHFPLLEPNERVFECWIECRMNI